MHRDMDASPCSGSSTLAAGLWLTVAGLLLTVLAHLAGDDETAWGTPASEHRLNPATSRGRA